MAGLILSVCNLANAGLITYEMEFTIIENNSGSFGGVSAGSIVFGSVTVDDIFGNNLTYSGSTTNADLSFTLNGIDLSTSSFSNVLYSGFADYNSNNLPFSFDDALFDDVLFRMTDVDSRSLYISSGSPDDVSWYATDSNNQRLSGTFLVNQTQVPEPSTLAIFALGLMGMAARRFKIQ